MSESAALGAEYDQYRSVLLNAVLRTSSEWSIRKIATACRVKREHLRGVVNPSARQYRLSRPARERLDAFLAARELTDDQVAVGLKVYNALFLGGDLPTPAPTKQAERNPVDGVATRVTELLMRPLASAGQIEPLDRGGAFVHHVDCPCGWADEGADLLSLRARTEQHVRACSRPARFRDLEAVRLADEYSRLRTRTGATGMREPAIQCGRGEDPVPIWSPPALQRRGAPDPEVPMLRRLSMPRSTGSAIAGAVPRGVRRPPVATAPPRSGWWGLVNK